MRLTVGILAPLAAEAQPPKGSPRQGLRLVFRDQPFTDGEQLAFARRLDGGLQTRTAAAALGKRRLGAEALSDISNVDVMTLGIAEPAPVAGRS